LIVRSDKFTFYFGKLHFVVQFRLMLLSIVYNWRESDWVCLNGFDVLALLKRCFVVGLIMALHFVLRDRSKFSFPCIFHIRDELQGNSSGSSISLNRPHIFIILFSYISIVVCAIIRNEVFSIIVKLIFDFLI